MSRPAQQSLFENEVPPAWEADDEAEQSVATVVFPGPLEGEFDYLVPDQLRPDLGVGQRVAVPLGRGNRPAEGYCVRLEVRKDVRRNLKSIAGVVDDRSLLSPAMIRLTQWMAEHYLCSWGTVLEAVVPAGVRGKAGTRTERILTVPADLSARMAEAKLPAKQAQVVRIVAESREPMTVADLARAADCREGPIKALVKKGLLVLDRRRAFSPVDQLPPTSRVENLILNADQQKALEAIHSVLHTGKHETILLRGVTGSGKTEVYIQAIQEMVRFGRQAIVLVPEISLTPQTVERFRSRFDEVAVLHSHLSDSERHRHWERIATGKVPVVVGARSAIFAPTPQLGLIVIDEEHESSFKQDSVPRYHARDVAVERARAEQIPLVLGSATPALESYQRAVEGIYRLIELPRRVENRPMPGVRVVDLRQEVLARKGAMAGSISRPLKQQMDQVLTEGGQVILLLNRRGYSTHIQCPHCGHVVRCPLCDIALTWHKHDSIALCHHCDFQIPTLKGCPECNFEGIRYNGAGTQKVEAEVRARFPGVPCLRMDTDTMQSPGSHERALARFRSGEIRILLGTQMIAKGHDFPNVTLVGVLNADTALNLPDFRAAERTFQLLVQVSGRTGRSDQGGKVIVQTFSPDHPAVQAAARHDYTGFATGELPMRKMFGYPPYGEMIRMVIRGPKAEMTMEWAGHVASELKRLLAVHGEKIRILGPVPAAIARLREKFRFQVQLLGPDGAVLRAAMREVMAAIKPAEDVEAIVDVDPISML